MSTEDSPTDSDASTDEIRRLWEARARSPYRDFYVASHRGWDREDMVEQQARFDAEIVLHGLSDEWLGRAAVLEIGCGTGRLAAKLAARVRSYTGFDISQTMVDAATELLAQASNARVLLGSGDGVPSQATDRPYDLVFSHAVLIHLPRSIIASYLTSAWPLVADGGQMRLQLLADPDDPSGITAPEDLPTLRESPAHDDREVTVEEQRDMDRIDRELDGKYYMGAAFRFAEVEPFLRSQAAGAHVVVARPDPHHIYVQLKRDAARREA